MSNLGSIVVSLEANIARFESDLGKAEQVAKGAFDRISKAGDMAANAAKGIGLAMAGLAAGVGINTLVDKFEAVTKSLSNLKEMSERTGASVENLSGLSMIAKIGGRDFGEMESAINKMNKALHSSEDEGKGAAKALAALGLDITKLKQLDPAQAFLEIAKAQEKFADGGGKSAVMMEILGKSGAQQIPLMHDLAAAGDLVTKTTDAQAEAAKKYEQDVRRLTATKEALYKVIAQELIPVMDDVVKVMIQANNETDGVRQAAKNLAADGSIREWAKEGAMALMALADAASWVVRGFAQSASSIGVVLKDISFANTVIGVGPIGALTEKGQASIKAALDERNAYVEKANIEMMDRFSSGLTPYTDKLRRQFAADQVSIPGEVKDTSLNNFTRAGAGAGRAGSARKSNADPFGDWLKDLESRIKPAEQAIANFTKLQQDAETSAADLTKAEKVFYDLIQSPEWKTMPEPWKDLVRVQFEAANAAEKVAKEQKIIADLLAATPTAKLDEMRTKMLALADAFEKGRINEEQFIEASQTLTGNLPQQVDKATSEMDEFAKKAAGNMQNALADFLFDPFAKGASSMVQEFGKTIQKMIAQAASAQLLKTLFGDMGKDGKVGGLVGSGLTALASLFELRNGGVMTSAGTLPLNTYAGGGIANSPQLAMFGEGHLPEAYVPLPDGHRIPVQMAGTTGNTTLAQTLHFHGQAEPEQVRRAAAAGGRAIINAATSAGRYR